MAFLEDADGVLKELRITLGVAGKPNTPGVVQQISASCRLSVSRDEVEVVNRILLSFKSCSSLSSLFLQLVSAFSHISDIAIWVLPNK